MARHALQLSHIGRRAAKCAAIGALTLLYTTAVALANCTSTSAPDYADVDRIALIRCAPSASVYPCFRATLAIKGGRFIAGRINAYKGLGLRGQYTLTAGPDSDSALALGELKDHDFFNMVVPPAKSVIDGMLDVIAIRACGTVKVARTLGDIDDASHLQWIVLLDRLQATLLTLHWRQVSAQPDYRDAENWYTDDGLAHLLEP
jgi:hypothetical protein